MKAVEVESYKPIVAGHAAADSIQVERLSNKRDVVEVGSSLLRAKDEGVKGKELEKLEKQFEKIVSDYTDPGERLVNPKEVLAQVKENHYDIRKAVRAKELSGAVQVLAQDDGVKAASTNLLDAREQGKGKVAIEKAEKQFDKAVGDVVRRENLNVSFVSDVSDDLLKKVNEQHRLPNKNPTPEIKAAAVDSIAADKLSQNMDVKITARDLVHARATALDVKGKEQKYEAALADALNDGVKHSDFSKVSDGVLKNAEVEYKALIAEQKGKIIGAAQKAAQNPEVMRNASLVLDAQKLGGADLKPLKAALKESIENLYLGANQDRVMDGVLKTAEVREYAPKQAEMAAEKSKSARLLEAEKLSAKQSLAPEAEQPKSTEAPTAKKAGGIAKGLKSIAILPVIGGLVDAISTLQKTGEIENSNLPTEAKTAAIAHNVARTMGGFVDVSAGASIPAQELAREALVAKHGKGIEALLIPTDAQNLKEASEIVRLDNAKELAAKGQEYRQEMNARAAGGNPMDRAMEMAKAAGCTGKSYECVGVDQNLVKANQLPKLEVAGRNQTL